MGTVEFVVSAHINEKYFLGVVGDRPEIGKWLLQGASELAKDADSDKWRLKIRFGNPGSVEYRYFVGRKVRTDGGKQRIIVDQWESGPILHARKALIPGDGETNVINDGEFGIVGLKNTKDQGWLSGQTEVRFTLSANGEAPVLSWHVTNHAMESLHLWFSPLSDVISYQVTLLEPHKWSKKTGVIKSPVPMNDQVLTFAIQTGNWSSFSGKFTIVNGDKVIGHAAVASSQIEGSTSYLKLGIFDECFAVIGSLHMECVVIKTYENQNFLDMRQGFCNHWKKRPTLHIGHRGCGNSFTAKVPSDLHENTLKSFISAANHRAAMIEFDVQLTKDKVPIVFHDFTICTSVLSKQGSKESLLEVEIQSLNYHELMEYRLRHRARKAVDSCRPTFDEDSHDPDLRPFSTLKEVMEKVPEHTGFDIELKWPEYNLDKSYSHGVDRFCDANEFVDKILDIVFSYCKARRIVFSTFDTNICTFLRRKQNRFPVIFLMDEGSIFMDLRSRYNRLAIPFASSEKFAGICFSEQTGFSDNDIVECLHNQGLLCFFYGDRLVEKENRDMLSQRGADGIIYDRIHQVFAEGANTLSHG